MGLLYLFESGAFESNFGNGKDFPRTTDGRRGDT